MTVRNLRAALTAILLGTAMAGAVAVALSAPAQALTVSAKVGPLVKEAQALIAAKNYKAAAAKLSEAEAVKSTPDDTTVINQFKRVIAVSSADPSTPEGAKAKFAQLKGAGNIAKIAMTWRGGTHDLWIRYWLASAGINPDADVSLIVIPPPQMVANMKTGTQDAFCVGEPWNGQLVNQKIGYTACLTSEMWMNHPEKCLGVRADWVAKYPRAAQALTMAVMEAQMWCDKMANRPAMCSIVSGRQYINVPMGDILPRLQGTVDYGDGRTLKGSGHVMKFWADNASFPWKSHDLWFLTEDVRWGVLPASTNRTALVGKVNRADVWREAAKELGAAAPASDSRGPEKFFDGKVFDPGNSAAYLASQPIKRLT